MSVQVEKLEHNMAKLTITVPAETFDKAITAAYNKMKNQISVPGFRKGKVKQAALEKMYGASMFYEQAANIVMQENYDSEVAAVTEIEITSEPTNIDVVQVNKGQEFIFTAEVATKPEVTLGQYKGIEVPETKFEVTEEEVEAEVKKVQEQNAREISVERPAENGDTVVMDYAGSIDGVAFDGGTAENQTLVLGSGAFIPGFEDQLVGQTAGSDVEVHVTFPEEYHAAELAGKEAVFAVKLHEVKAKELPELNDDFAQDVSEFDTLAEYKEDVKKNLTEGKEKEARLEKQEKVITQVVANAEMDIPDAMVTTQARQNVNQFAQQIQSQGLSIDQYFQFTGLTAETLLEQLKPQALKNIQNRLALEAVVKAENIEVSEEELDGAYAEMAEAYHLDVAKIKEIFAETEGEEIKKDVAAKKALDLITDAAVEVEVTEVEATVEE